MADISGHSVDFLEIPKEVNFQEGPLEEFLVASRSSLALGITNTLEAFDEWPLEFLRSNKGNQHQVA